MEIVAATETATSTYTVTPVFDEEDGIYRIGVPFGFDPTARPLGARGSPAAAAGLTEGDRLLEVVGGAEGLPLDRQLVGPMTRGEALTVRVQTQAGAERTIGIEPARTSDGPRRIGVASTRTLVGAVRTTGPAAGPLADLGLRAGGRLRSVQGALVTDPRSLEAALLNVPGDRLWPWRWSVTEGRCRCRPYFRPASSPCRSPATCTGVRRGGASDLRGPGTPAARAGLRRR